MSGFRWSDKEKAIVKKLWPEYVSGRIGLEDISAILNRSNEAVRSYAGTLGLTNQVYDTIDYEALKRLEDQLKIKVI